MIRNRMKGTREKLDPEQRLALSNTICSEILRIIPLKAITMVYAAKGNEVETGDLIKTLIKRGSKVVVPIIEKETCSLRLSYLIDPCDLVISTFSVPEPIGKEITANPEDLNFVIIPVLAFDREGNRLGYGAGYYDRFLGSCKETVKIGAAYSFQGVNLLPSDNFDIKIDMVVTEEGCTIF